MIEILKDMMLPSHVIALLLLLGSVLLFRAQQRQWAAYPFLLAALLYLVFSNGIVASMLISPLEYRYPPVLDDDRYPALDTAVVLTAYAADDPRMPLSSRAGSSALYRVLEAGRLFSEGRIRRIVISGDATATAIMAELLESAGVPAAAVTEDGGAVHTSDSAQRVAGLLGEQRFYLITSAGHMPRAMGVFEAQGSHPVPAPTDYQLPQDSGSASLMPSPFHLLVSDLAVNEYAALAWYRISGKTGRYW